MVVAVFMGWRVSVLSFECGGRTYAIGPRGSVVAGDSARSRFELRVCSRASDDAVGNDADRIEMRFRDSNNLIDLKCSRTSLPGTWPTVSHISGPTLIQTSRSVRTWKGSKGVGPSTLLIFLNFLCFQFISSEAVDDRVLLILHILLRGFSWVRFSLSSIFIEV